MKRPDPASIRSGRARGFFGDLMVWLDTRIPDPGIGLSETNIGNRRVFNLLGGSIATPAPTGCAASITITLSGITACPRISFTDGFYYEANPFSLDGDYVIPLDDGATPEDGCSWAGFDTGVEVTVGQYEDADSPDPVDERTSNFKIDVFDNGGGDFVVLVYALSVAPFNAYFFEAFGYTPLGTQANDLICGADLPAWGSSAKAIGTAGTATVAL